MKIEKFLIWIQDKMLNYPDIDFKTIKMFIDKFHCYMSKKEKERWSTMIQMIKEFTSKQISIDSFVHNEKIKHLYNELNELKKDG